MGRPSIFPAQRGSSDELTSPETGQDVIAFAVVKRGCRHPCRCCDRRRCRRGCCHGHHGHHGHGCHHGLRHDHRRHGRRHGSYRGSTNCPRSGCCCCHGHPCRRGHHGCCRCCGSC